MGDQPRKVSAVIAPKVIMAVLVDRTTFGRSLYGQTSSWGGDVMEAGLEPVDANAEVGDLLREFLQHDHCGV